MAETAKGGPFTEIVESDMLVPQCFFYRNPFILVVALLTW